MKISTFRIEKMDCPTEERLIRNRLGEIDGIEELDFNLIARTLTVSYRGIEESSITAAIETLGMEAVPQREEERMIALPVVEPSFWRMPGTILTIISGVCALAAEILSLSGLGEESILVRSLAIVAIVAGGYETAGKAWIALRALTLNIHFLMSLAVIGAVALGEWTEAGMVIFLFAVAELVEAQSLNRARKAIRMLMELTPEKALVMNDAGGEIRSIHEIERGSTVRIKPGERLPLDGVVRTGRSSFNQAPITGESMPVEKGPGDRLFAGSINTSGTVDYEVTHTASESTISRIAQMVEKATANRGRTERFVDRFARYYTPTIFAVAFLVAALPPLLFGALWSEWIYSGLVILVIGCPCALVISTPVTIVSGLSAAARRGILVKGGEFLELGRDLKGIAFDKTGTLTEARPRVTDVVSLNGLSHGELLHLAAAVEGKSEHPIASAIIAEHGLHHEDEGDIIVHDFEGIPGRGARGIVDGRTIYVGNHRLAHDLDVCSDAVEAQLRVLEADGKTTVVVMDERETLGVIGVADTLRATSFEAIERLHTLGLRTAILTGDNAVTAASIARCLGIDDVRADLLPGEKIDALKSLQDEIGPMGMVGEGINDVPALAHATVGFAMGAAGADVALETADVALMNDDLLKIPEFIGISRRTIQVLKQNIAIALGLKGIFFILALIGEATLWMAVFADMGASLIVVFNGLRLLRRTLPMKCLFILFLIATSAWAQPEYPEGDVGTEDPFAVVAIDSYRLTEEEFCTIVNDRDHVELRRAVLMQDLLDNKTGVAVRRGGAWIYFEAPFTMQSIEHRFVDLDGEGDEELVLMGERLYYGSGGGLTEHGIMIYRIDTSVTRLMQAMDGFKEEAFAREYNRRIGVLSECTRTISVLYRAVQVSRIIVSLRNNACAELTPLREGIYMIRDGALVWVAKSLR